MENATKALLIAAAVLVAVLIITLGIVVYTRASEAVEGAGDLSEYQILQFNDKFTKYQGENVAGSEVNALLTTAFNHNNKQEDTSTCVTVTVKSGSTTTTAVTKSNELSATPTPVSTGARYKVKCTINTKSKLVESIAITQN